MSTRLQWSTDGRDWPHRDCSRFVTAGGLTWHVQRAGKGPVMLLLHGTGAATHSWRGMLPLLARQFTILAPDLPGHGFTDAPPPRRMSLPSMAASIGSLLQALELEPELAVGHSAGAAILGRMVLDRLIRPRGLVSINGAMLPLSGFAGHWFSPIAKLLVELPLFKRLSAWRAGQPGVVEQLLKATGSRLDAEGIELYRRVASSPGHVGAALDMMANWDLEPLRRALPQLETKLLLIVGERDRTIPPAEAANIQRLVPSAQIVRLPGLGHLAHEEDPAATAGAILRFAQNVELLAA